ESRAWDGAAIGAVIRGGRIHPDVGWRGEQRSRPVYSPRVTTCRLGDVVSLNKILVRVADREDGPHVRPAVEISASSITQDSGKVLVISFLRIDWRKPEIVALHFFTGYRVSNVNAVLRIGRKGVI